MNTILVLSKFKLTKLAPISQRPLQVPNLVYVVLVEQVFHDEYVDF